MTITADSNLEQFRRVLPDLEAAIQNLARVTDELGLLLEPDADQEVAAYAVQAWLRARHAATRATGVAARAQQFATAAVRAAGPVPHLDAAGVPDDYDWVIDVVPFEGAKLKTRRVR